MPEWQNKEYASKGVAGTGLGFGIAGTALGLLQNGGLGNILGGNCYNGCSENTPVNRFELQQEQRIAELQSEVKLRDANTYTLQQISATKEYLENKIDMNYREQACINKDQAAYNAASTAGYSQVSQQVRDLQARLFSVTQTVVPENLVCNTCCPTTCSTTVA